MSIPPKNFNEMTPREKEKYLKFFSAIKIYGGGKASASLPVDNEKDKLPVQDALRDAIEIFAKFNIDKFRSALAQQGLPSEVIEEYSRRVVFDDDTYGHTGE